MPDVRNCRRCGKIFNYIGGPPICPVCKQADEEDFKRVKQYLYDNPGATISQVSTELEVSVEKIKRFLREGRLEIVNDDGNFILECERCGKAIKSGRFCNDCERDMTRELQETAGKISNSSTANSKRLQLKYLSKDLPKKSD